MRASSFSEMMSPFSARKKQFIIKKKTAAIKGYFLFSDKSVCPSAVRIMTDSKIYGIISEVYRMIPYHIECIDI